MGKDREKLADVSCSAYPRAILSATAFGRIIWSLITIFCVGGLSFCFYQNLAEYLTFDLSTSIMKSNVLNQNLLPEIVICNLKRLNPHPNDPDKQKYEDISEDVNAYILSQVFNPNETNKLDDDSIEYLEKAGSILTMISELEMQILKPFSYSDFLSYQMDKGLFILRCRINKENCKSEWIKPIATESYGMCYILKDFHKVLTENKVGAENGIELLLYLDRENSFSILRALSGIRITLMYPGFPKNPDKFGIESPPGRLMKVAVSPRKYQLIPTSTHQCRQKPIEIKKQLPFQSTLGIPFINEDGTFPYSHNWCQIDCIHKASLKYCKCPASIYFDNRNCTNFQPSNLNDPITKCIVDAVDMNSASKVGKEVKKCSNNCEIQCENMEFATQISYSEFPTSEFFPFIIAKLMQNKLDKHGMIEVLKAGLNKNVEHSEEEQKLFIESKIDKLKNELVYVQIYLEELMLENVVLSEKLGWWGLISNVGGTAGLFMGGSIATIFEICDILRYFFCRYFCKRKRVDAPIREEYNM